MNSEIAPPPRALRSSPSYIVPRCSPRSHQRSSVFIRKKTFLFFFYVFLSSRSIHPRPNRVDINMNLRQSWCVKPGLHCKIITRPGIGFPGYSLARSVARSPTDPVLRVLSSAFCCPPNVFFHPPLSQIFILFYFDFFFFLHSLIYYLGTDSIFYLLSSPHPVSLSSLLSLPVPFFLSFSFFLLLLLYPSTPGSYNNSDVTYHTFADAGYHYSTSAKREDEEKIK